MINTGLYGVSNDRRREVNDGWKWEAYVHALGGKEGIMKAIRKDLIIQQTPHPRVYTMKDHQRFYTLDQAVKYTISKAKERSETMLN